MQTDLIIVTEYCNKSNVEPSFLSMLEEDGLIQIQVIEQEQYLLASQLSDIERFSRLHYDLAINVAGIDVINQLQQQMKELRKEIEYLKSRLSTFPANDWDNIEEF